DDGARLVHAVVVAGDGARADIDPRADVGVANIGKVVDLGAGAQHGLLDLDEVAHMGLVAHLSAGSQARIRPDNRFPGNRGIVDVGVGVNAGPGPDGSVAQHAVRADLHAIGQFHPTFEHAAHINEDIAATDQFATQI